MKLIIAGGRDYQLTDNDTKFLCALHREWPISEVVSGGASGSDRGGEEFACNMNIPVKQFKAEWSKYDKAAGPLRNKQMAQYANAVVLFPGGDGTSNMRIEALKAGLTVYDWSHEGAVE